MVPDSGKGSGLEAVHPRGAQGGLDHVGQLRCCGVYEHEDVVLATCERSRTVFAMVSTFHRIFTFVSLDIGKITEILLYKIYNRHAELLHTDIFDRYHSKQRVAAALASLQALLLLQLTAVGGLIVVQHQVSPLP